MESKIGLVAVCLIAALTYLLYPRARVALTTVSTDDAYVEINEEPEGPNAGQRLRGQFPKVETSVPPFPPGVPTESARQSEPATGRITPPRDASPPRPPTS